LQPRGSSWRPTYRSTGGPWAGAKRCPRDVRVDRKVSLHVCCRAGGPACRREEVRSSAIGNLGLVHETTPQRRSQRGATAGSSSAASPIRALRQPGRTFRASTPRHRHRSRCPSPSAPRDASWHFPICEKKKRASCLRALRIEMIQTVSPRSVYVTETTIASNRPRPT